jgi:hypothetical protein
MSSLLNYDIIILLLSAILKHYMSFLLNYNIFMLLLLAILKHWVGSVLSYCADDDDIVPIILFAATYSDFYTHRVFNKIVLNRLN